jgi:hypothetical protein
MNAPSKCPKCRAGVPTGEKFCASCGFQIQVSPAEARDIGARVGLKHEKQTHQQRIRSGRVTILVVAGILTAGAFFFYASGKSEVGKAKAEMDRIRGNEKYDQEKVAEADRTIAKADSQNTVALVINLVVAACFVGLWVWAKSRALPATLAALILFITVIVIGAVMDPADILKGIIMKVAVIAFLVKAVDSARKYQRMQEHGI